MLQSDVVNLKTKWYTLVCVDKHKIIHSNVVSPIVLLSAQTKKFVIHAAWSHGCRQKSSHSFFKISILTKFEIGKNDIELHFWPISSSNIFSSKIQKWSKFGNWLPRVTVFWVYWDNLQWTKNGPNFLNSWTSCRWLVEMFHLQPHVPFSSKFLIISS